MNVKWKNLPSARQILHVDMDSFFASVAQADDPFLQGRPIVICGKPGTRTVVAASSKEAKKFGIKSGMATWEATRLCPQILLVPGNPKRYQEVHHQAFEILYHYTPEIEVFSIDEWFLDITQTVHLFGNAIQVAQKIKRQMQETLGDIITCSIGIGPNKMLAKVASDLEKPNGITTLENLNHSKISLESICGIGPRIKKRLSELGVGDLASLSVCPTDFLLEEFGVYGKNLSAWARGQDDSLLIPFYQREEEKTFGHSYTLPQNTLNHNYLKSVLLTLAEKVAQRMRKKRFYGRTIHLWICNHNFLHFSKQKTFPESLNDGYLIYQKVWQIFRDLKIDGLVRALGISVSSLTKNKQLSFLSERNYRSESLTTAIDQINQKYGPGTILKATQLQVRLIEHTGYFSQN